MNILLLGSGGREHALAWKISQSPQLKKLYASPGNDAIAKFSECVSLDLKSSESLFEFAKSKNIGLVVVGPEAPLVEGIADLFQKQGIPVFGPSAAGAQLEASKAFTKNLCKKYNIPTAAYECFQEAEAAKSYLNSASFPIVIKADGLAAGKGVVIAETLAEANEAVEEILVKKSLGEQNNLVIESFLRGEEASFMVICDGNTYKVLASSQDHKRVRDNDEGPNTGGMGAYSPAPVVTARVYEKTLRKIIEPTLVGLKQEGIHYQGVLYAGLMIENEEPQLLEYNVRFGDPECEVILPRLKSDLLELMLATAEGRLSEYIDQPQSGVEGEAPSASLMEGATRAPVIEWHDQHCVGVVLAAENYPATPTKGDEISGIEDAEKIPNVKVFHSGTVLKDGKWRTNGGRVLVVTALGEDLQKAQANAYEAVSKINWRALHYRKDIAAKALFKSEK